MTGAEMEKGEAGAQGPRLAYWAGAAVAIGSVVLLVLVIGAVGFLGSEDNPNNLVMAGVSAVALAGALIARFRAAGMAKAMAAAAAAQLIAGAAAVAAGLGSPGFHGVYEVFLGTILFGGLWLASAALFRKAAREQVGATGAAS
jgi:hypothetical protein